jgi:hypothetical protein
MERGRGGEVERGRGGEGERGRGRGERGGEGERILAIAAFSGFYGSRNFLSLSLFFVTMLQ